MILCQIHPLMSMVHIGYVCARAVWECFSGWGFRSEGKRVERANSAPNTPRLLGWSWPLDDDGVRLGRWCYELIYLELSQNEIVCLWAECLCYKQRSSQESWQCSFLLTSAGYLNNFMVFLQTSCRCSPKNISKNQNTIKTTLKQTNNIELAVDFKHHPKNICSKQSKHKIHRIPFFKHRFSFTLRCVTEDHLAQPEEKRQGEKAPEDFLASGLLAERSRVDELMITDSDTWMMMWWFQRF